MLAVAVAFIVCGFEFVFGFLVLVSGCFYLFCGLFGLQLLLCSGARFCLFATLLCLIYCLLGGLWVVYLVVLFNGFCVFMINFCFGLVLWMICGLCWFLGSLFVWFVLWFGLVVPVITLLFVQ